MEEDTDAEEVGVAVALEKICALESRLRQAIQSTHTLHRSFGKDMGAVDREREALLLIREHLELLEDKLREYRTTALDPRGYDDKAIALSQLDGLRKDLLRTARDRVDYVLYNKDVVKDILAFVDSGAGEEPLPEKAVDGDLSQISGITPPQSPLPLNADATDWESGAFLPSSSAGVSPFGRKDLSVNVGDSYESLFPFPAPASTPSVRAPQPYSHPAKGKQEASAVPSRPPKASGNGTLPSRGRAISSYDAFIPSERSSPRPPSSYVESSQSPTREYGMMPERREVFLEDADYGGKVSLTVFNGREKEHEAKQMASTSGHSDHPKIVHDPSYAEEQRRMLGSRAESEAESGSGASKSPIRKALQRRAAANQMSQSGDCRARRRQMFNVLGSCIQFALAGAVGAATAVTISSALQSPRDGPHLSLPRPRLGAVARRVSSPAKGRSRGSERYARGVPRADGHLVPDWMHRSHFQSTENPPTGALTSTADPPGGEMFPVIPPPHGMHVKG